MKLSKIFKNTVVLILAGGSTLLYAEIKSVDIPLSSSMGDTEEYVSGGKIRNDARLNLGFSGKREQIVGLRFTGIPLKQGDTITNAYLSLVSARRRKGEAGFEIYAEASADAALLSRKKYDLSSRVLTEPYIDGKCISLGWPS